LVARTSGSPGPIVIVDPEDREYVLAAGVDWQMHWYWYLLWIVLGLACAAFSAQLLA
jgi:hypothetical protein